MIERLTTELQHLWLGISLFIFIVFLLNKTDIFRHALIERNISKKSKFLFIVTFSIIGILGTYWGLKTDNGIINTRAVGVIVSGIIGGPIVGFFTGLITGIHRMFFLDTFTSSASGTITFLQGLFAGFLSQKIKSTQRMWLWALILGFIFEGLHMLLLFVLASPTYAVCQLVKNIAPSMLVTNSIAICLFIGILEDTLKQRDLAISNAAKSTFRSINLILNVLKSGFSAVSAKNITKIIIESLPALSYVAILSENKVIALTPKNKKDYKPIKRKIETVFFAQPNQPEAKYPYSLAIPILAKGASIGRLVVKKDNHETISQFEKEFIFGISNIIENLLHIEQLKEQSILLSEAEIKVLQAQINPHFLFNALNTIAFYCRSEPLFARQLIIYLADYYRHSLSNPETFINLSKEIKHIKAYINIEMARFGSRLNVKYDIYDKQDFHIPALIMQPLVENAIKHGILPKAIGGTIFIGVIPQPDYFKFYVCDNGTGIDKEKLSSLLIETRNPKSIGLINVHKRLLSIYGDESGLTINSEINVGTTVSFKIPRNFIGGNENGEDNSSYSR